MKKVYPVLFKSDSNNVIAYIPDFDIFTQGKNLADAICMAREAIGINGIDLEEDGKSHSEPSSAKFIDSTNYDVINLVDVDFSEYRRKIDD